MVSLLSVTTSSQTSACFVEEQADTSVDEADRSRVAFVINLDKVDVTSGDE